MVGMPSLFTRAATRLIAGDSQRDEVPASGCHSINETAAASL